MSQRPAVLLMLGAILGSAACQGDVGGSTCDAAKKHVRECSNNQVALHSCDEAAANRILAISCQDIQQQVQASGRSTQGLKDIFCQFLPDICDFFGGGGGDEGDGEDSIEEPEQPEEPAEEPEQPEEPAVEEPEQPEEPAVEEPEQPEDEQPAEEPEQPAEEPEQPVDDGCQGETWEGRCENNTVIWCEGNTVKQKSCTVLGLQCMWYSYYEYFDCG
jgi:hypothetical protein